LTYFVMVLMAKKGITIDEIRNELSRRRKWRLKLLKRMN
jgi:phosphoribosyl-ATP pyrophosphohydrolase